MSARYKPRQNDILHSPAGKVLSFLKSWYGGKIDIRDFAAKTQVSYQYASAFLRKGDMKLSKAEGIARAYGHTLYLYYPVKTFPPGVTLRDNIKRRPPKGNLTGLIRYAEDSNLSPSHLASLIGKSSNVLINAFASGDIFLSTLYEVTDILRIDITWEWLPNNGNENNNDG